MSVSSDQSDAVLIDQDDISNYNPEHILPEPAEIIQKIRRWLQPTSYDIKNGEYRRHLASHVAGTGAWLTSTATYQDWLTGQDHGLLWIKGIPGSGKSVVASKLIDELTQSHPGVPVLYFFFRQIIDANHQPAALLRDWLDQVLSYSPPLQKQLKEYVDNRRLINSLSIEDLFKLIRLALAGLPGKVFCVADALDEMDRGNDAFLEQLAALGQWKPRRVKVLITSRPVPSVEGPLRTAKALQIRLQEKLVDVDIASFVEQSLQNTHITQADQTLIKEAVPGRAHGLFLYAKLAMDAFLEPGVRISDVLEALPADLNDMYTSLLEEHARRSGVPDDIQLLILQWVTHATRPLRLLEMAEMINVTYRKQLEKDLKATKDLVRAACGPLLEILPDETVCVVHHSFTEYLKGSTRLGGPDEYPILRPGPTNAGLARACLAYLKAGCLHEIEVPKQDDAESDAILYDSDDDFFSSTDNSKGDVKTRLQFPFLQYAAQNWFVHVSRSAQVSENQAQLHDSLDEFFGNRQCMVAWLKLEWRGRDDIKDVNQLHIASKTGLDQYVERLLGTGRFEVDARDVKGKTSLWWASSSGHAGVIRLLIQAGANPDQEDRIHGYKPLHEAAGQNYHEAVKVLLEAGVDPLTGKSHESPGRRCGNAPTTRGHTPLMYACQRGHLETVNVFLSFITNVDTVHRALMWAAESGHSNVVARILQHPGVDVNAKVRGDTPLFAACGAKDMRTIACLVDAGADPKILSQNAGDEFGGIGSHWGHLGTRDPSRGYTPLHKLCHSGGHSYHARAKWEPEHYKTAFDLLIQAGVNIEQRTDNGSTALHCAIYNPVMLRLLLDAGANANIARDDGGCPIHDVKSLDSLTLLVEHGNVDINKKLNDGRTALLCMLSTYHTEVTLKFLEYGPDCNVVDKNGEGVLHLTVKEWNTNAALVKALLEAGADPNMKNRSGKTPLHVMRFDNKQADEMMDLLIGAGADVNARDNNGATVLFLKVANRAPSGRGDESHKDVKALLVRGASQDIRDYKGRTLLHEAVRVHEGRKTHMTSLDPDTTRFDLLRGLGLDVHATDHQGNTLLHEMAGTRNHHESYHGPNYVPLWRQLLALGLDPSSVNHRGRTPLHIFCTKNILSSSMKKGQYMPIDLLISVTKDVNCADQDGITPLHLAATTSISYTKKLLMAGADPSSSTMEKLTPLHLAARARESNIVGLLLETLRQAAKAEAVSAKDENGSTPLDYACRSGRPESVSLLLEAGANIEASNPFAACAQFQAEQQLWARSRHPADQEANGDASGLMIQDTSRPTDGTQSSFGHDRINLSEETRLEEILEMLVAKGVDVAKLNGKAWHTGPFDSVVNDNDEYTVRCLNALRERKGTSSRSRNSHGYYLTTLAKNYDQVAIKTFRETQAFEKGKRNSWLLCQLLKRREYFMIEEMHRLGASFLPTDEESASDFAVLISHGFANLVEKIGTLEAERTFEDGTWHAAGDITRPGLGCQVSKDSKDIKDIKRGTHSAPPFLLQAVQRSLPNMDVMRLLVEKFSVDVNELHYTNEYIDGTYKTVARDSALLSVAKGESWWQVALAIPYLIENGANPEIRNYKGQTPLHLALGGFDGYTGTLHRDAACALITAGADVNAVDAQGNTCLAYAGHDVELIRLLLSHGASVKADALFSAIEEKRIDVLEALLSAGADPNMRRDQIFAKKPKRGQRHNWQAEKRATESAWYPVHKAATMHEASHTTRDADERAERRATSAKLVEILLAHGADPFAKFYQKIPDYDQSDAEEPATSDDAAAQNTNTVASPHVPKGYEECTLLHELLLAGELVQPFWAYVHLDPNHRDAKGRTVLHAACASRRGPDAPIDALYGDKWDSEKMTTPSLLNHLLAIGADPLARDNNGRTILHHMLALHKKTYSDAPAFTISLAQMAKKYPALLEECDEAGRTPLHYASLRIAAGRNPQSARILLDAGADPLKSDGASNTMLHFVAEKLLLETNRTMFRELLSRGLTINAPNSRGETPLFAFYRALPETTSNDPRQYRSFAGFPGDQVEQIDHVEETMKLWKEAGADFFARDNKGRGLLHVAAKLDKRWFKGLMGIGLDAMVEDGERRTALDVAAAFGNEGVLGLFEREN